MNKKNFRAQKPRPEIFFALDKVCWADFENEKKNCGGAFGNPFPAKAT
jgi:hypothetical protein